MPSVSAQRWKAHCTVTHVAIHAQPLKITRGVKLSQHAQRNGFGFAVLQQVKLQ